MRRPRITITLNKNILQNLDKLIDGRRIRNRSHAIEFVLSSFFRSSVKKAVILAGGQGTSLRPYTYEVPKSLLPIKGKPILEYLIENLKRSNISDIIICVGYLGKKIVNYFGNGEKYGVKIIYSEEKEELQTGGTLLKSKKYLSKETFLVIHGDIVANIDFEDILSFHEEQSALATIALTTIDKPTEFGQIKLHGRTLVDFYQQTNKNKVESYLVNCGIYVFDPEIFDYFPKNKTVFRLEDVIGEMIKEKKVNGFVFEGQWFDVGNPKNYEKAIKEFLPPNQK